MLASALTLVGPCPTWIGRRVSLSACFWVAGPPHAVVAADVAVRKLVKLPAEVSRAAGRPQSANQAVAGSGHGVNWRPHLSRSAFARIADSCSLVRFRRPDSTAAFTAAIADTS